MVLGIYYLTTEDKTSRGSGSLFLSEDEAIASYRMKKTDLHAVVFIPTDSFPEKTFEKSGILVTTIGKIILNSILPKDYKYVAEAKKTAVIPSDVLDFSVNRDEILKDYKEKTPFDKGSICKLIEDLYDNYDCIELAPKLDAIKNLGFEYSTHSCITISAFDVPDFKEKYELIYEADKEVEKQKQYMRKGLITDDERYKNVIGI